MRAALLVLGIASALVAAAAVVMPLALVWAIVQDDDWIGEL